MWTEFYLGHHFDIKSNVWEISVHKQFLRYGVKYKITMETSVQRGTYLGEGSLGKSNQNLDPNRVQSPKMSTWYFERSCTLWVQKHFELIWSISRWWDCITIKNGKGFHVPGSNRCMSIIMLWMRKPANMAELHSHI